MSGLLYMAVQYVLDRSKCDEMNKSVHAVLNRSLLRAGQQQVAWLRQGNAN